MAEESEYADVPRGETPGDMAPGEAMIVSLRTALDRYLREHGEDPAWQFEFGPEVDEDLRSLFEGATPTLNDLFRAPAGHDTPFRPWVEHLMREQAEELLTTLVTIERIDLEGLAEEHGL